jgi:hypothetical protein
MKRARTHAELLHGGAHQRFARVVEHAVFTNVSGRHIRIAHERGAHKPIGLPLPGGQHASAHDGA